MTDPRVSEPVKVIEKEKDATQFKDKKPRSERLLLEVDEQ